MSGPVPAQNEAHGQRAINPASFYTLSRAPRRGLPAIEQAVGSEVATLRVHRDGNRADANGHPSLRPELGHGRPAGGVDFVFGRLVLKRCNPQVNPIEKGQRDCGYFVGSQRKPSPLGFLQCSAQLSTPRTRFSAVPAAGREVQYASDGSATPAQLLGTHCCAGVRISDDAATAMREVAA